MWETTLDKIIEEQFWLSKKCNITVTETNNMAEFERSFYVNLLIKNLSDETESISAIGDALS